MSDEFHVQEFHIPEKYSIMRSVSGLVQVGACGGSLRIEQCERMHIVAAAHRITIGTCRDSTLNIASNTPPLLAGDNRFIQLAPFNTAYEALPAHLKVAGITRVPFHWGNPLEFTREPNVV